MFYPEIFAKGKTRDYEKINLPLVEDGERTEYTFKGRLIGQKLRIDDDTPELLGEMITIYELEDNYLTYLAHFNETQDLWETGYTETAELNYSRIREGLLREIGIIGDVYFTNIPKKLLANCYTEAVENLEARKRQKAENR